MVSVSNLGFGSYGTNSLGLGAWGLDARAPYGQTSFPGAASNPYASASPYASLYDFGTTYGASGGLSPDVLRFLGAQAQSSGFPGATSCGFPGAQGGENGDLMMQQQLLQLLVELALMLAIMQALQGGGRDLGQLGGQGGFGAGGKVSPGGWGGSGASGGSGSGSGGGAGSSGGSPRAGGTANVPANMPTGRGTAGDFLKAALAQNGDRYVYGAETNLNDKDPDTFDCSELVQWAAAQAGVNIPDGSGNQAAYCRQHGKQISVEEAIRTPGALLFKEGHVAISLGDGRTIEAMGSKWGVCIGNARGRFTSGGLIPGMSY